ncbi:tRNA synthetases class I (C) catalytic domain [Phytophthora infestans]|uniref:cysteine--tRNA ligase n=1 Tax=Phytophthora infestans TaxID=4787 RepID=A0A833RR28_PHYIN|nr:tRNA synthetases class I (C) catalytic domain [Phytophthora infestans]
MRMLRQLPAAGLSRRAPFSLLSSRWLSTLPCPPPSSSRDLKMFNALTGECEPFPRGTSVTPNILKWYACGPTVYDKAHLGHARAYVSQDILRRVAERTGGYNVQLVMGVTDVDDKIIKRAKEQNVSYHTLAREQEQQFFADMARLYVKPPTAITRVSEHLPEIVKYIEEIQHKGFAYQAVDGSGVYFNTRQLGDKYGKLDPRRQTQRDEQLQAEAEAAVEESDVAEEEEKVKRDPRDFALWKAAKEPDEPAWPSPWGLGRPGWHIECSAMTHHVLGDRLDVHTGGVDLRFPHHNNEIAQCEAHNHGPQCGHDEKWCNHFVHFGHLYIRGRKMSKSLKNFISVRDFLAEGHTADHFRLFCLQFKYRASLVYSEDRVRDAEATAGRLRGFFRSVVAYGSGHDMSSSSHTETLETKSKRCEQVDLELLDALFETRALVDAALLDDLDTPRALSLVLELVSRGNAYLLAQRGDLGAPDEVLISLTGYVLEVLELFGLEGLHSEFSAMLRRRFTAFGHPETQRELDGRHELVSRDDQEALIRSLLKFRASVREEALRDPKQPGNARVLALCDALRNEELPQLGIQIEDLAPGRSVFKLLSRAEREAETEDKATTADNKTHALKQKQQEFEALMQISPSQFFQKAPEFANRFDTFDADGFPSHEDGAPLSKSQSKKLAKKLAKHEKSYAKFWESRRQ